MTDHCDSCGNWIVQRKTVYSDGSEVVTFQAPEGKGRCTVLDMEVPPEFGCLSHKVGEHVVVAPKEGIPWQIWELGPCPDCEGRGTIAHGVFDGRFDYSVCARCTGTGRVRHYDDGHIGENRHCRHPKESQKCTPTADPGTTLQPTSQPEKPTTSKEGGI